MEWRAIGFDWNAARAFLVTAREGSFSEAARALGLTQPTVGRQVARLEEELGVLLFERIGNRLELTASGVELLEHASAMGEGAMALSLAATGQATAIEGTVSITASEAIAAYLLPPVLARLRAEQPGIEIELVAANDPRDLQRREADIAIRNFQSKQPDLISKKLGESRAYLYATPAYLAAHGPIESVADVARLEIFAFDRGEVMVDGLRALGLDVGPAHFPIVAGNHLVQWQLCRHGVGVCIMMEEVGEAEPAVVKVLPDVAIPVPIWLVCHRELRTSRRIRLVFDLLAEMLGEARR